MGFMNETHSPLRALAQEKLGDTDLDTYVTNLRDGNLSWDHVARALTKATGLDINRETLRRWMVEVAS